MYNNLKDWINVPVAIKSFIKRSGTGDKEYSESVSSVCYPLAEVKVVVNNAGTEVVSNNQLYFDGSISVTDMDAVIFEGKEYEVKAVSTFYRGGTPDIKVVYL